MRRRRIKRPEFVHDRAYREAFKRLDASLENGTEGCYAEKIEILGRHLFGDLWDDENNEPTVPGEGKTV